GARSTRAGGVQAEPIETSTSSRTRASYAPRLPAVDAELLVPGNEAGVGGEALVAAAHEVAPVVEARTEACEGLALAGLVEVGADEVPPQDMPEATVGERPPHVLATELHVHAEALPQPEDVALALEGLLAPPRR